MQQKIALIALLAGTTAAGAGQSRSVVPPDDLVETLTFQGARTLEVSNVSGSIRVVGYDGDDVEVVARKAIRADTDAGAREAGLPATLAISDENGAIRIVAEPARRAGCGQESRGSHERWHRPAYRVDFDLRVPRGIELTLCTVTDGDIHVLGTSGDFDVENVNGDVTMTDARGAGRVVTVNGQVVVSFAENPRAASLFRTVNGSIDATFRQSLSANLKMKTFNGGLFSDFEVVPLPRAAAAAPERRNGRFVYRGNSFTTVRAGDGGPELTFETLNGDVRVLRQEH